VTPKASASCPCFSLAIAGLVFWNFTIFEQNLFRRISGVFSDVLHPIGSKRLAKLKNLPLTGECQGYFDAILKR
jgi:hypothetical protein